MGHILQKYEIMETKMKMKINRCDINRPTITHKISETNSSFHVKKRTTGKVSFLFSKSFLLVLTKLAFWHEDWELYHSMKFRHFPNIS